MCESLKAFIEKTLHQPIQLTQCDQQSHLPLLLRSAYDLYDMEIIGHHTLLAKPTTNIGLVDLRKHQQRLESLTGIPCVLYLTKLNPYSLEKMLEEGIPFVLEDRQIYMPFLGILLKTNGTRAIKPCNKISFLTQKLLLLALYEGWQQVTVTQAAKHLGVSKMSITRCFDEIESLQIPIIENKRRIRYISCKENKKLQWDLLKNFTRPPVIQEFYLEEDLPEAPIKSGISALSDLSLLADNHYPTRAMTKAQIKEYKIKERKQVPKGETPGCVIQELGYLIPYNNATTIDPLTTSLILAPERSDPRLDQALDAMLEKYVWQTR
jgi:hypothetical protein